MLDKVATKDVEALVAEIHRRLADEESAAATWLTFNDIASYLQLRLDETLIRKVMRRKSIRDVFAKAKLAYVHRGLHLYVYTTDDEFLMAKQVLAQKEEARLMAAKKPVGQIVLTPGVVARVPSSSKPNEDHEVRLSKNGLVYCDCEGYRWRGHCAHIDTVIAQNPGAKMMVKAGLREKISHLEKVIEGLDAE